MNLSKMMSAVAAISLVAAPVAAQAGTKASSIAVPARSSAKVGNEHRGVSLLLPFAAAIVVITTVVVVATNDSCDSPGGC